MLVDMPLSIRMFVYNGSKSIEFEIKNILELIDINLEIIISYNNSQVYSLHISKERSLKSITEWRN
jgi:hypothetical protein